MRSVAVVGIGQIKIGEHWEKSLKELAGDAIFSAQQDAEIEYFDSLFVGNMMSASANKQQNLGAQIADWIGARGRESIRIESACSSGSAAFRSALMAVASNQIQSAIVVGVEKMTDSPSSEITASLATAADADWEVGMGVSFVALNALIMQRYMYEYGWKKEDFSFFSINAHQNALNNPNARLHMKVDKDKYCRSAEICEPISLMDASSIGDGAAAVFLLPWDAAVKKSARKPIRIAGSGAASDTIAVHGRKDPLWLTAAEISSKKAYSQAGIQPHDIDLFEYHDAFTIMAALSLESNGFAKKGEGVRMALDELIKIGGTLPVATMGGLKARGHPVGATGMYQIVEVVQQLRGDAGKNQVAGAEWAMSQNIGGSGSNIITHVFRNA
jgi:acetyl-CoA C-acetyltransferase